MNSEQSRTMSTLTINRFTSSPNGLHKHQGGLTLVEIMVAITLSLLLLAGVMQIFISSKASYNLQNGIGRLQENARFATDILADSIGMAGMFTNYGNVPPFGPFTQANVGDNVTENATLGMTTANGNASDTIEVNFQAATDCLGNPTAGTVTNRFFLNGTNLMCLGNGNATAGIIAEGIESLQVLYGEDTDGDGTANRYVSAANLTWTVSNGNTIPANTVTSVRIAVLASSVSSVSGAADTNSYALLNAEPIGPIGDNLYRRVYTRTILLRNPYSS